MRPFVAARVTRILHAFGVERFSGLFRPVRTMKLGTTVCKASWVGCLGGGRIARGGDAGSGFVVGVVRRVAGGFFVVKMC